MKLKDIPGVMLGKLEDIGFYTLSDKRAKEVSLTSNLKRCEILLTDKCNLKCPYCRGMRKDLQGEMSLNFAKDTLKYWIDQGLENIRFSGGEPTLYPHLKTLVKECKNGNVKRIALSTNGTQDLDYYKELVDLGVNDFSISLDGGCCAISDKMTGGITSFNKVSENIKYLSWYNYVTVGVVFNELNVNTAMETVKYVDSLNPSDIRIISSAQYNKALDNLIDLPEDILNRHPILKYRINNYKKGRNVRSIKKTDCNKCHLVKDDVAVAGKYHFPCIIYLREGGNPIGEMGKTFREERFEWFKKHNTHKDPICKKNCLDICIDYNNKCEAYANNPSDLIITRYSSCPYISLLDSGEIIFQGKEEYLTITADGRFMVKGKLMIENDKQIYENVKRFFECVTEGENLK